MAPRWILPALVLLACQHRAPTVRASDEAPAMPPSDAPSQPEAPTDAGVSAPESPLARRLSVLADETLATVARVRGLGVLHPVARGVMSRTEIVARLRARTRQEYPPGEVELEGELLKRLGLIPEAMNYEQSMYDLLEEQVLGFYDPDERRLYIADWVPPEAQAQTMAHELTHALQDQHFQIARHVHHVRGHGDAQLAAMAVLEGDATASMTDFAMLAQHRRVRDLPDPDALMSGQVDATQQPRMAAAPRAIRETLLFPYLTGFSMCARLLREGSGYSAIDALLARPPDSSEQVLHPDKLTAREAPVEVPATLPPPLARTFTLVYDDVMGELNARFFFEDAMNAQQAESAAAGWGGDRAVLLAPNARVSPRDGGVSVSADGLAEAVLVWTVAMDDGPPGRLDAQALEFSSRAAQVLAHRYPTAATATVAGALAARTVSAGRVSLVARAGQRVLVADRLPAVSAAAVVAWFAAQPTHSP